MSAMMEMLRMAAVIVAVLIPLATLVDWRTPRQPQTLPEF
jgi:hypothetical protein